MWYKHGVLRDNSATCMLNIHLCRPSTDVRWTDRRWMQTISGAIVPSSFEVAAYHKKERGFFILTGGEQDKIWLRQFAMMRFCRLLFGLSRATPHRRQAADKLAEHTSGNLSMLAKRNNRSQNKGCVLPGMLRGVNALLTESLVLATVIRFWCNASPHGVMDRTGRNGKTVVGKPVGQVAAFIHVCPNR